MRKAKTYYREFYPDIMEMHHKHVPWKLTGGPLRVLKWGLGVVSPSKLVIYGGGEWEIHNMKWRVYKRTCTRREWHILYWYLRAYRRWEWESAEYYECYVKAAGEEQGKYACLVWMAPKPAPPEIRLGGDPHDQLHRR